MHTHTLRDIRRSRQRSPLVLGGAAKRLSLAQLALRLADRQSRTLVPLHNSHARAATGAPLRASQQQASTHARAPKAFALCFAAWPLRACEPASPLACTIITFLRRGSATTCTTFPTSLLSICLLVCAIAPTILLLLPAACLPACTIIPPRPSRAPSQPAAKLGCNTGLQCSLCPSLHLPISSQFLWPPSNPVRDPRSIL